MSDALQGFSWVLFPGAEADPMGGISMVSVGLCHGQILSLVGIT